MKKISNYNVAVYLRLSREDGDDRESQSIGNQRKIINDFIENSSEKEKFNIVREYIDDGFTGSNFDRPDFKRMISDIERQYKCSYNKGLIKIWKRPYKVRILLGKLLSRKKHKVYCCYRQCRYF